MKAVVFGALLSQGIHAQILSSSASSASSVQGADIPIPNVSVADQFSAVPAPVLTPGPDAPSEADLLSSVSSAELGALGVGLEASASLQASAGLGGVATSSVPPLPVGTADVIIGASSSSAALFGGTTTPGAGAGFIGSGFSFPGASASATPIPVISAANAAISNINSGAAAAIGSINSGAANAASAIASAVNGLASPVSSSVAASASSVAASASSVTNQGLGAFPIPFGPSSAPALSTPTISSQSVPVLGAGALATPSSSRAVLFGLPDVLASALNAVQGLAVSLSATSSTSSRGSLITPVAVSASGGFGFGAQAVSEPTLVDTPLSGTDAPLLGQDLSSSSTDPGFLIPSATNTDPGTATPAELDVPYATPAAANNVGSLAAGLQGIDDNTNYDGQDYGDESQYVGGNYAEPTQGYSDDSGDDVPCPSYCQTSYQQGSSRRSLRSRQQPASGGFAAFNWPDSSDNSGDAADDDIPDWLYSAAGKQRPGAAQATQANCPASCYKPQQTYKPYPTSAPYQTQAPYPPSYSSGRPNRPYGTRKPYRPYPSAGVRYNSTALESPLWTTTATETPVWNLSSTITATTLATVTVPGPNPPFSSIYASDQTWTGDTLAGVCPKTCDPFHPDQNFCDITSSCATAGGSKYYCACRAGYMASAWNAKDFSKQFHVPGQPYVYVAPGVVCDKVCDDQTCTQVLERPKCV